MSVSSLEAELSRQNQINHELRQELNEIEYGVTSGYRTLEACNEQICTTLGKSHQLLENSRNKGLAAIELQGEIDKMYVKFKQMELANKRIRECNNRKYYEFANYRTVRKLVQGMMDNLDVNMVSDAVIYKSVEEQHLKTPDYWLTCVLISIMAWKSDDKALAERAVNLAVQLDKKSSSVFYMLFNLRVQRNEAALKWFLMYQECPLQGSDQRTFLLLFALISKTLNQNEAVEPQMRDEINAFIREVVRRSAEAEGYSEDAMVARIKAYYDRMDAREQPACPLLKKHCKDFSMLSAAMRKAKGNLTVLEFVKSVIHVDALQRNAFIKNFIDGLISQANDSEKEVYDTIRYNEMIIRCQGEVETAKVKFEAEQIHDETALNLIGEMIDWIFTGDPDEVNVQSRLNMFTLTQDLQKRAIEARTQQYRAIDKTHLTIQLGEYSTKADFSNRAGEEQKVGAFYREKCNAALAAIKDWPAYIGFGVAAAAAVASFFTSFALLIVTVIGAGFGGITLLRNKSRRAQLHMECDNNTAAAVKLLQSLFEEHSAYCEEWSRYDAYAEQIMSELEQL